MAPRHKCHLSGLDGPLIGPICFTPLVPEGKRHSLASKDLRQNDVGKAGKRQASKIDFFSPWQQQPERCSRAPEVSLHCGIPPEPETPCTVVYNSEVIGF